MKYFAILLFALSLEATAATQRADRTITWQQWQEWAEFRVRTGDRYLGGERWEHYLAFGLICSQRKSFVNKVHRVTSSD